MSTNIYEKDINISIDTRSILIKHLKSSLNAAESNGDIIIFEFSDIELDIDFESGEISITV